MASFCPAENLCGGIEVFPLAEMNLIILRGEKAPKWIVFLIRWKFH